MYILYNFYPQVVSCSSSNSLPSVLASNASYAITAHRHAVALWKWYTAKHADVSVELLVVTNMINGSTKLPGRENVI